jgi:hypothetical protein
VDASSAAPAAGAGLCPLTVADMARVDFDAITIACREYMHDKHSFLHVLKPAARACCACILIQHVRPMLRPVLSRAVFHSISQVLGCTTAASACYTLMHSLSVSAFAGCIALHEA